MKWLIVLLAALVCSGFWFARSQPEITTLEVKATASTNILANTPIIVELFTSEGCSSCPPADRLLTQLAQAAANQKAALIPLSEHVDYWNDIGWADPFSAPAFSERQRQYAKVFGARGGVYTPQMVIDGHVGFVGSNATKAQDAIAQAAQAAKANMQISLTPNAADKTTVLRINVTNLPSHERAELMLAVTEDNLTSNVTRGENSGRRLPHTAVTRLLKPIAEIEAQAQSFNTTANLKLDDRWQRTSLHFVAFVQEHTPRRIIGAATTRWGAATTRLPDK